MAEVQEHHNADPALETEQEGEQQAMGRPAFTVVDRRFWVARADKGNGEGVEATTPAARMPTYVEQLQAQLEEKDHLLSTHIAELRQEQAELRQRLKRDFEQRIELTTGNLLAAFLPVLDNLDRALQSAAQHPNWEALLAGIELVRTQFLSLLERHELKVLNRLGQPFDPSLDEAMAVVEVKDPAQHNLVLQEWEKGYTLHDKVLRPAKVTVGKMVAED